MHDVRLVGEYVKTVDGAEYVKCILPYYEYFLATSETGLPANNELVVEISLNGKDFSDDGKTFKFILNNQRSWTDHSVGPETGGTAILISLEDFTDNNEQPKAGKCIFSGYEDYLPEPGAANPGHVEAVFIKD